MYEYFWRKCLMITNKTNIQYYCKKCKEPIGWKSALYGTGLCMSCARIKQLKNPKNHPMYKHGETLKKHYCKDCNRLLINYKSKRCKSCASKHSHKIGMYKLNWNTIKGLPICLDCDKVLKNYNSKRCPSHAKGGTGIPYENAEYPKEFNTKLRNKIRDRDKHKCQCCYKTEKQEIRNLKRRLHIHHIDYNKYNCIDKNLITVCFKCNIRANYNKDYWYAFYNYILEEQFKDNI